MAQRILNRRTRWTLAISDQLHAPAALLPRKHPLLATVYEVERARQSVSTYAA